jgi:AcrR family transcriptional regulator
MAQTSADTPPEGTRAALIAAGVTLFGSKGFAATSTREIAARAKTNVASIAYHFGGKEGLRQACGAQFAQRLTAVLQQAPVPADLRPDEARALLHAGFARMIGFILGQAEAAEMVSFMLREVSENSPIVDQVYAGFMEGTHRNVCVLWGLASGCAPESDAVRLSVFSFIGQILYFRIGNKIVARRMGWDALGQGEAAQITAVLLVHLDAMLGATGKV